MTEERSNPTVLLVEDSEDDAFFFTRTLESSGATCAVHHAPDGRAALDFLLQANVSHKMPHIIFLDLKMPMMNGFEVLQRLRETPELSHVPVVALSGSERQDDINRAKELGAAEYLVKPLRVNDLRRLLADICPAGQKAGAHC